MVRGTVNALLFLLVTATTACAYKPGPISTGLSAGQDGRIFFQSVDAYDFGDLNKTLPPRTIHGDLSMPEGTPRGAVILSHGSGGPGSRQRRAAEALVANGYAAFLLDHFSPRDISSTVRDQLRVTAQGMMADVFAAQRLLATHPDIAADKIGLMGWSKGGIVALLASVERFSAYADPLAPLAFSIAFYPFCGFDGSTERLAAPLLIQIGSEDDWTPAEPCRRLVDALSATGQPAGIDVFPGAYHGFDSRSPQFTIGQAISVRDLSERCTLTVDAAGRTVTLDGGLNLTTIEDRSEFLDACGVRGVIFEGNAEARAASAAKVQTFIQSAMD